MFFFDPCSFLNCFSCFCGKTNLSHDGQGSDDCAYFSMRLEPKPVVTLIRTDALKTMCGWRIWCVHAHTPPRRERVRSSPPLYGTPCRIQVSTEIHTALTELAADPGHIEQSASPIRIGTRAFFGIVCTVGIETSTATRHHDANTLAAR